MVGLKTFVSHQNGPKHEKISRQYFKETRTKKESGSTKTPSSYNDTRYKVIHLYDGN